MSDTPAVQTPPPGRNKGGRPKIDPAAVRTLNFGVRVSPAEYAALRERAEQVGMTPAQFLRHTGLTPRLPPPPVPPLNRDQQATLDRMVNTIAELAGRANEGKPIDLPDSLVRRWTAEIQQIRRDLGEEQAKDSD